MRILHTADWHIGKNLRGRSRMDEHTRAVEEVLDIALRERVDLFVMAGDLFDSQAPAADSERLIYEFFAKLAAHRIPAVVIGGNHDHPKRLDALRPLLDRMSIHLRPYVCAPSIGGVIELAAGGSQVQIACLPFVPEHKLLTSELLMGEAQERFTNYADRIAAMLDLLCAGFRADTVNLVVGHVYLLGAEASGSERAAHLARPYALTAQRLPATASYVALGHLHRPQQVEAPSPTVYSGSLLQLDFGEAEQKKSVVIVDAVAGRRARIERIPVSSGRTLRMVRGTMEELRKNEQARQDEWLQVVLQAETRKPGLAEKVRELLPQALDVRLDLPSAEPQPPPPPGPATPIELFQRFHQASHGELQDSLQQMFQRLYEEAAHAAN
jgi:exonuclease SbcD